MTTQQKIAVLENIDWDDMIHRSSGLCSGIWISIDEIIEEPVYCHLIQEQIELFSKRNAVKFSSRGYADMWLFWFSISEEGYEQRKRYVNWMIEQYKSQLS
jgi:hypothetical protein